MNRPGRFLFRGRRLPGRRSKRRGVAICRSRPHLTMAAALIGVVWRFELPGGHLMRKLYPTPEALAAKRAYAARGQQIMSGAVPGLFERDAKVIRPEVRALIEAALEKGRVTYVEEFSRTEK